MEHLASRILAALSDVCDCIRHESAMAAEKEGGLKEAQLAQQRHETALSELQVAPCLLLLLP